MHLLIYLGQFSLDTQISNKSAIFPSGYNIYRTRINFTVLVVFAMIYVALVLS